MVVAKIYVNGTQAIVTECARVTMGMQGAQVQVEYNGIWNELNKTAVFVSSTTKDIVNPGSMLTIPAEITEQAGHRLKVGFYGVGADGTVVIPTLWADLGVIQAATDPSGDTSTDPELPVWAQLQKQMEELKRQPGPEGPEGPTGPAGPQGERGEQGNPGNDGFSPTVTVEDIEGGRRVTITDKDGDKFFEVMNADWAVSDPADPGYVWNRTHFEERETIFPRTYLGDSNWDRMEHAFFFNSAPMIAGETYVVKAGEKEYTAIAESTENGIELSAEKLWLVYNPTGVIGPENTYLTHPDFIGDPAGPDDTYYCVPTTVSIWRPGKIHKLDVKYLDVGAIAQALPSVDMVASFDDGSTGTFKLYGMAVDR